MRVVWLALILTLTVAFMPLRASANEEDIGFITRILQDQLSDAGREVRIIGFEGALSSRHIPAVSKSSRASFNATCAASTTASRPMTVARSTGRGRCFSCATIASNTRSP